MLLALAHAGRDAAVLQRARSTAVHFRIESWLSRLHATARATMRSLSAAGLGCSALSTTRLKDARKEAHGVAESARRVSPNLRLCSSLHLSSCALALQLPAGPLLRFQHLSSIGATASTPSPQQQAPQRRAAENSVWLAVVRGRRCRGGVPRRPETRILSGRQSLRTEPPGRSTADAGSLHGSSNTVVLISFQNNVSISQPLGHRGRAVKAVDC